MLVKKIRLQTAVTAEGNIHVSSPDVLTFNIVAPADEIGPLIMDLLVAMLKGNKIFEPRAWDAYHPTEFIDGEQVIVKMWR